MRMKWRCERCDKALRVKLGQDPRLVWHPCRPTGRRPFAWEDLESPAMTLDERRAAAWAFLGGGS